MMHSKYARILLFQFVFTKYVFGFRNYEGLIFVVFDVIFQNVIMRLNYVQELQICINTTKYDTVVIILGGKV